MWQDLLNQAIQAANAGDRPQAEELLSQSLQENPDSSQSWLWMGKIVADPQRKRECFEKALQLDSSLIEAWLEINKLDTPPLPGSEPQPVPASDARPADPLDLPDALEEPAVQAPAEAKVEVEAPAEKPRRDALSTVLLIVIILLAVGLVGILGYAYFTGGLHL